jgi:CRISPR-associated exonuclease Cas4
VDTDRWQQPERPLFSQRYGVTGKPDYVVQTRRGLIPIEVKPTRTAAKPYDGDVAQLLAYCLLIEDTTAHAPPYGLLRYRDHTFRVPYTPTRRAELIHLLAAMRADEYADNVPRSHQQEGRCQGCGFSTVCDERLDARQLVPDRQG